MTGMPLALARCASSETRISPVSLSFSTSSTTSSSTTSASWAGAGTAACGCSPYNSAEPAAAPNEGVAAEAPLRARSLAAYSPQSVSGVLGAGTAATPAGLGG